MHTVYTHTVHKQYTHYIHTHIPPPPTHTHYTPPPGTHITHYNGHRLRVAVEEEQLIDFFGRDFIKYRNTVPTRLPGVH